MHACVSKTLLVAITVILIVLTLMLWRPWEFRRAIDLEYVRAKLREIAEIIEQGVPATLEVDVPLKVFEEYDVVVLTITRPNEEPIVIRLPISAIVYEDRSLRLPLRVERRGLVEIVENGTMIILKPLPRVDSTVVVEYGREFHLVVVGLVKLRSERTVVRGKIAITFDELEPYTYLRSYDYSGVSKVRLGGMDMIRVGVSRGTGLKITIAGVIAKISQEG